MSDTLTDPENEVDVDKAAEAEDRRSVGEELADPDPDALDDSELDEHSEAEYVGYDDDHLPSFNGIIPTGIHHKIKTEKGTRIGRLIPSGERVVLLVEVIPDDLTLTKKNELRQLLAVEDFYEVTGEKATELLRSVRVAYREAADAARGVVALPFDGTEMPTAFVNKDGVAMTPSEWAELTGTPTAEQIEASRGVDIDPAGDTIIVEFADRTRGQWPDDWADSGQTLACVGGFMQHPGKSSTGQVARLIGMDDEILDEWTPEDESVRLERLEVKVAADEDAAAVSELEGARKKRGAK